MAFACNAISLSKQQWHASLMTMLPCGRAPCAGRCHTPPSPLRFLRNDGFVSEPPGSRKVMHGQVSDHHMVQVLAPVVILVVLTEPRLASDKQRLVSGTCLGYSLMPSPSAVCTSSCISFRTFLVALSIPPRCTANFHLGIHHHTATLEKTMLSRITMSSLLAKLLAC